MSGNPDRPSSRHTQGGTHQSSVRKHARGSPKLVCLFVSCLVWPALSASLPAIDDECEPKDCGVVHNVSYPFWIEERQPPQCGYPAFKLACKDGDAPRIRISGEDYAVARIFYTNQSFVVSSDNLSKSNCPVPSHNLSLDATPFSLNALDRNLSFFSGCPDGGPGHRIDCPSGGGGDRYIVVGNQSRSDREEAAKRCRTSVSWPYLGDGSAEGDENYSVLVKRGFLLTWSTVIDCSMCRANGGGCRYDLLREAFSCACSDRSHAISCNSSGPIISQNRGGQKRVIIIISISVGLTAFVVVLVGLLWYLWGRRWRLTRKRLLKEMQPSSESYYCEDDDQLDLQLIHFSTLEVATDYFSLQNKLGQGGYGPVYKGKLPNEQYVAIKRLSKVSTQGLEEFKSEVKLVVKLQHTNLVRLLGYCIENEEKILVYEYMENQSLDKFIFDVNKGKLLDWPKRLHIIEGITQGLLYLHKYSRLRVVHRDLKASNILLDNEWNPKIADFGLARIFSWNDDQANTKRIIGTHGYMPPEYAMNGVFSTKSDVFSFGVLLLEILSGKKNTSIQDYGMFRNLLGHAWELWREGRQLELVDPSMGNVVPEHESLRCLHVALLCVQESPWDRPTMLDIVSMLNGDATNFPAPNQPAFFIVKSTNEQNNCHLQMEIFSSSNNIVTMTTMEGR